MVGRAGAARRPAAAACRDAVIVLQSAEAAGGSRDVHGWRVRRGLGRRATAG